MTDELSLLRDELCVDARNFCRECFCGTIHEAVQNPPNVFRVGKNTNAKIFLVFDKPNCNDAFHDSDLVPITICDPRPVFGPPATHRNLLLLLQKLGLISRSTSRDPLDSEVVHITNAVKCDKSAATGDTVRISISESQARHCVSRFLLRELKIIRPTTLIFFGDAPQINVLGYSTSLWELHRCVIDSAQYWVMRVPHTSPQSFNTHGGKGEKYVEPILNLMNRAGAGNDFPEEPVRADRVTDPDGGLEKSSPRLVACRPAEEPVRAAKTRKFDPAGRIMILRQYDFKGKRGEIWSQLENGLTVAQFSARVKALGAHGNGVGDLEIYLAKGLITIK